MLVYILFIAFVLSLYLFDLVKTYFEKRKLARKELDDRFTYRPIK